MQKVEQSVVAEIQDCEREPIHAPSAIQPHGLLVAVDPETWHVRLVSENIGEHVGVPADSLLDRPLEDVLGREALVELKAASSRLAGHAEPLYVTTVPVGRSHWDVIAHLTPEAVVLEFEEVEPDPQDRRRDLLLEAKARLARLSHSSGVSTYLQSLTKEVRELSGYDRVMVYRFDSDGAGEVVAEAKAPNLEPYLGLHYPATDIPAQARALFLRNALRIIVDVTYIPVPLKGSLPSGEPLDMSRCVFRSVSPGHVQYMKNMGVASTLVVTIAPRGRLWGLLVLHHSRPIRASHRVRAVCELLGRVATAQIPILEDSEDARLISSLRAAQLELIERVASTESLEEALDPGLLLEACPAQGVALVVGGRVACFGVTPPKDFLPKLASQMANQGVPNLIMTDYTSRDLPELAEVTPDICGVAGISLSSSRPDFIFWFRREFAREVTWAGDPSSSYVQTPKGLVLHPRASFEQWKEMVRGRSAPWKRAEREAILNLRTALLEVVLRSAERLQEINQELEKRNEELNSFARIASHDLREPLRGIRAFSSLVLESNRERLDSEGLRRLETVVRLGKRMEDIIESLLYFSTVGRGPISYATTDLNAVVASAIESLSARIQEKGGQVEVDGPLPLVKGDTTRLTDVFTNLISNGLKYNRSEQPTVRIRMETADEPGKVLIIVEDNGIGVPEEFREEAFRVFKRVHDPKEFGEGSGIGLSSVRQVVERHGGRVWIEGAGDSGSAVMLLLPGAAE